MNKKDLKFYEAPMAEVVELSVMGIICTSTGVEDEHWRAREGELDED